MKTLPLIVFGAGGHGKVVLDVAKAAGLAVSLMVDDFARLTELFEVRVVESPAVEWAGLKRFDFVVAVGDNVSRARVFNELRGKGGTPINIVHPSAVISPFARLGRGVVVVGGAVINPSASIGENTIINTCVSVDHDCVVGDHVHLCPGVHLAGAVTVGASTMVGVGAVVLPGVRIGESSVVGAGAVVNRDLPARVVAYGNPAKIRRRL